MSKFPSANAFFALHELEDSFLNLGRAIVKEQMFIPKDTGKCREMGRASGYFASAHFIAERIEKDFPLPKPAALSKKKPNRMFATGDTVFISTAKR